MTRILMTATDYIDRRPNRNLVQRLAANVRHLQTLASPDTSASSRQTYSPRSLCTPCMASLPFALARIPGLTLLSGSLAACVAQRLLSRSEISPAYTWSLWSPADPSPASSSAAAQRLQWDGPEQVAAEAQHSMLLGRGDPRTRRGKVIAEARPPMRGASACSITLLRV